jgi:dTDP-4-dehydrorhamnose reductase
MAQWAARQNVPFVHFSTDYVFDGSGMKPWREDSPTGPLSVYGTSKLAGEAAVRSAGGQHLIVRTSWVYAAHGANFLRTMARSAKERKELRVVTDQIGAPTSARVIADTVIRTLQPTFEDQAVKFEVGGTVNIACAGETSWHGFAVAIVTGLKSRGVNVKVESIVPIATREYPTKAVRPGNSRLDLSRLEELFGIIPPKWHDALDVELDALVSKAS